MKPLVIIPTYNEIENIEKIIRCVFSLETQFHILIVDDNSPDGTAQKVSELQQEFPELLHLLNRKGKEGLGKAYLAGFDWALENDYEYIIEMDADFSHPPHDLPLLLNACVKNQGLAIGSRYVKGVNVVNWPMSRILLSWFASKYVRFITRMNVHDATAGFVCYHRSVLQTIPLNKIKFKGYAFQIEMKFKTWKYGFEITEIPIIFTDRREGTSKMSGGIIKEALFGVIELKIKSWFTTYKK